MLVNFTGHFILNYEQDPEILRPPHLGQRLIPTGSIALDRLIVKISHGKQAKFILHI